MDDALKVAAQGLLQFGKLWPRGTITDVYWWPEEHRDCFAFTGDGEKISKHWMDMERSTLRGPVIDRALSAIFGLKPKRSASDYATIFGYERDVTMADFFDRLGGNTLYDVVTDHKRDGFFVTVIPEPGYPWPVEDGEYYSAREDVMRTAERPKWLIEVTDPSTLERLSAGREVDKAMYGVNPCLVFPPDETRCQRKELLARLSRGGSFMVAHSMGFRTASDYKSLDYAIDGIKSCGGLLFPSLSVGEIPASNFGPVTLVAPVDLVVASLKPYRVRGRRPCWVYDSDAWTVGTGEMMKGVAIRLFEELHGHENWIYGIHMWTLGPPRDVSSLFPGHVGEPIDTTAQLGRAVRQRIKPWRREHSVEQLTAAWQKVEGTKYNYGYSEAKGREVVGINEFLLLVAPKSLAKQVKRFVAGVGYSQRVVLLDASDLPLGENESEDARRWASIQWAWRVRDAVEEHSRSIEVTG